GTAMLVGIFAVWVLAVNGVVDADTLAGETGTALAPLARRLGPSIQGLGSVLVILLLGVSCLRTSTVLFNLVQECIPVRLRSVVRLPRRRGNVVFRPGRASRAGPSIGISYLGLADGHAHLRVDAMGDGVVDRADVIVPESWDASALFERLGSLAPNTSLSVEVLDARPEAVSVRFSTTMSVELGADWIDAGVRLADIAASDDSARGLITWMTRRREATRDRVVPHLDGAPPRARDTLAALAARGAMRPVGPGAALRSRVQRAARHGRRVPSDIWHALDVPVQPRDDGHRPHG